MRRFSKSTMPVPRSEPPHESVLVLTANGSGLIVFGKTVVGSKPSVRGKPVA